MFKLVLSFAAGALAATPDITWVNNDEALVELLDLIIGTQTNKFCPPDSGECSTIISASILLLLNK